MTIGIELNNVIRDINKQIVFYYSKEYDPSIDVDDFDLKDTVLDKLKFKSKKEKSDFMYVNYPYEIFGCANSVDKKLPPQLTVWIKNFENVEDEEINVIYFSMDEHELSIQSTFFFLSKIGARVRKVIFPNNIEEVYKECDVVITSRNEFFESEKKEDKKLVKINTTFNQQYKGVADLEYDSMIELINDNNFLEKVRKDV